MKIFLTLQKLGAIIGIASNQHPFNWRSLLALFADSLNIVLSVAYLLFEAKSFQDYAETIYAGTTIVAITTIFAFIVSKMRILFDFLNETEKMIDGRLEDPISKAIYENFNDIMEITTKIIYYVSMKIVYPLISAPILIVCFYAYFFMDLGRDAFHYPFPYWFPFDWKNPTGYLMAFTLIYTLDLNLLHFSICGLLIGIGVYMLVISLTKDMKNDLIAFSNQLKTEPNPMILAKQLFSSIQFHSDVKIVLYELGDLIEPIFTVVFLATIITICVAMLSIEIEMTHDNFMGVLYRFMGLFCSFATLFLSCELCDRMNSKFDDINDLVDEFDWHLFPLEMKQMLPIIMMNTQKPVGFKCFGSYLCNRDTFKKVIKSVFTYFMVLRRFG